MAAEYTLIVAREHTEEEFRRLWHDEYTSQTIYTHDGILVRFFDDQFDHAFFESSRRNVSKNSEFHKDTLSFQRLARIKWIKEVLADPEAEMYVGYDHKKNCYTRSERVSVVKGNYVVVIRIFDDRRAKFITAYVADNSISKIKRSPKWHSTTM